MPRQLTFELGRPEPPAFGNFLTGDNRELVDMLLRAASGMFAEASLLVWGPEGAGKSHLLAATVAAARAAGRSAALLSSSDAWSDRTADEMYAGALVAVDAIDEASDATQGALFTLYNRLAAGGGQLVAAASAPPARLALRGDLRTRLGHGLVYELAPLRDDDKAAALARHAQARGFLLGDDVIEYLLAHYRRDMTNLLRAVAALDRHSLSTKRPITVALLRVALEEVPPA